jgi:hypothetical protein
MRAWADCLLDQVLLIESLQLFDKAVLLQRRASFGLGIPQCLLHTKIHLTQDTRGPSGNFNELFLILSIILSARRSRSKSPSWSYNFNCGVICRDGRTGEGPKSEDIHHARRLTMEATMQL